MDNKIHIFEDKVGFVSLVDKNQQDGALKVVNSARISYNKSKQEFDDKDKKLTRFLWTNEHTSPFRHIFYTFHIKAPLFVFRQWMKYQVGSVWKTFEINGEDVKLDIIDHFYDDDKGCSWNEVSGRYVELKPEFYFPEKLRGNPPHGNKQVSMEDAYMGPVEYNLNQMHHAVDRAYAIYEGLLKTGVAREVARMILPQNIYSEAYWTCSLQSVIHFLHQRLKNDAQFEIRKYAEGIYNLVESDLTRIGLNRDEI
jgi:thymidylate synthase (FAD)